MRDVGLCALLVVCGGHCGGFQNIEGVYIKRFRFFNSFMIFSTIFFDVLIRLRERARL